jgi:hypothetical protein
MEWITANWVNVVAALWTFDQLLKIIAKMTKNKVDDNISDYIGKILAMFLPKKD